jgi:UDP-galactopyranose mutase
MAMSYDERYMNKDFQFLPVHGFTRLFEKMLAHENISVTLNEDAAAGITLEGGEAFYQGKRLDCLVYTGEIDALFNYAHGALPYRSLRFTYDHHEEAKLLPEAIVSYPQAEGYTRKTEYKRLMHCDEGVAGTVIATEYPAAHIPGTTTPYYPILTEANRARYDKYLAHAGEYNSLFLCGRLAEFKYYNMDDCILRAFDVFLDIKNHLQKPEYSRKG